MNLFTPFVNGSRTLTVSSTAGNIDLVNSSSPANAVLITNQGNQVAYFRLGSSPQNAAVVTDCPVLPQSQIIINRAPSDHNIGVVADTNNTTTLKVTTGYASR